MADTRQRGFPPAAFSHRDPNSCSQQLSCPQEFSATAGICPRQLNCKLCESAQDCHPQRGASGTTYSRTTAADARSESTSSVSLCEQCSECEQMRDDCCADCCFDCSSLDECDGTRCGTPSYCDMCNIDDSEFHLLGQPQSFWSPASSEGWEAALAKQKCVNDGADSRVAAIAGIQQTETLITTREDAGCQTNFARLQISRQSAVSVSESLHNLANINPSSTRRLPIEAQVRVLVNCEEFIPLLESRGISSPPVSNDSLFSGSIENPQPAEMDSMTAAAISSVAQSTGHEKDVDNLALPAAHCHTGHCSPIQCQWDDAVLGVCGQILASPDELHEHLRSTHGVANEVFCRWAGCRCGHTTAFPHYFAGGVLRHTWGHSKYRPYKCPTCHAGFSAAEVRDEHLANVHLGQKQYSCDVPGCGHVCSGLSNLRRHKQDKHGDEQFQCEFCHYHGKRRIFPRAQNLRRHFRTCKFLLARYPFAHRTGPGQKICREWLPPGYSLGHGGMNRAKAASGKPTVADFSSRE